MSSSEDHLREFESMGREEVRSAILHRRWDPRKLSEAREWLERQDARIWLASRQGDVPRQRPAWVKKTWGYIVAGMGVAYVTLRLVRLLRYGA